MKALLGFVSGLLFGLGLLASGMTEPLKVKGFLDLAGAWNPSLALVMGGAVAVGMIGFAWARRRGRTLGGAAIQWPAAGRVDARLIAGGLLFGAGWGLAGYCPGPALVALGSGATSALFFVPAMLVGMALHDRFLAPGDR